MAVLVELAAALVAGVPGDVATVGGVPVAVLVGVVPVAVLDGVLPVAVLVGVAPVAVLVGVVPVGAALGDGVLFGAVLVDAGLVGVVLIGAGLVVELGVALVGAALVGVAVDLAPGGVTRVVAGTDGAAAPRPVLAPALGLGAPVDAAGPTGAAVADGGAASAATRRQRSTWRL